MVHNVTVLDSGAADGLQLTPGINRLALPLLLVAIMPLNLVLADRMANELMRDPQLATAADSSERLALVSRILFTVVAVCLEAAILAVNRQVFSVLVGKGRGATVDFVWLRSQLPGIVAQWIVAWRVWSMPAPVDGPPPIGAVERSVLSAGMLAAAVLAYWLVRREMKLERSRALLVAGTTYGLALLLILAGW